MGDVATSKLTELGSLQMSKGSDVDKPAPWSLASVSRPPGLCIHPGGEVGQITSVPPNLLTPTNQPADKGDSERKLNAMYGQSRWIRLIMNYTSFHHMSEPAVHF